MGLAPAADQLLDIVAEVLEEQVLPAVPAALQHQVRVAASLARIVERELVLAPAAAEAETEAWAGLLGHAGPLPALRAEVVDAVRAGRPGDGFERRAWAAAVAVCRRELAIVKPGHDSWEGD